MIGVFDIELLSPERLEKIIPYSGDNINQHRLLVSLYFLDKGKLKESPLNTPYAEKFEEYLGMSNAELVEEIRVVFGTKFETENYERLVIIYILIIEYGYLAEYSHNIYYLYKYDQSYLEHINNLSEEDLGAYTHLNIYGDNFPEILKVYASRIYDNLDKNETIYFGPNTKIIALIFAKMAYDRNEMEFYKHIINSDEYSINNNLKIYAPSEILYKGFNYKHESEPYYPILIERACQSVTGNDLFFKIDLMTFSYSIELIMKNYPLITCREIMDISREHGAEKEMFVALVFNGQLCENDSPFKNLSEKIRETLKISGRYQGLPE